MCEEHQPCPKENRTPGYRGRWTRGKQILVLLSAAALALLAGFVVGAGFGGTYAPDFSFLGMRGYEGSGLLGGLVCGVTVLLIGAFSTERLRRKGAAYWVLAGALAAIVFGPRLLFPRIPPQEVAFVLLHVGCAFGGALIGWGMATLTKTPTE